MDNSEPQKAKARLERLREIIRSLRHRQLVEHVRGLDLHPVELARTRQDWDAETERLIEVAQAAERGG